MKGVEFVTWGKLYNIRFFRNTGVVFPKGKLHEDTFTTYKIVYQASKVVFTTFEGYYYRIRENSIMTEAFNLRHLDLLEATEESCNFFFKCEEMLLYDMAVNNHIRCCFRIYLEIVKEFGENCIITSTFRKQYFDNALALMKKTDMPVVKKIVYGMAANTKNLWLISRLLQYSKRRSIQ